MLRLRSLLTALRTVARSNAARLPAKASERMSLATHADDPEMTIDATSTRTKLRRSCTAVVRREGEGADADPFDDAMLAAVLGAAEALKAEAGQAGRGREAGWKGGAAGVQVQAASPNRSYLAHAQSCEDPRELAKLVPAPTTRERAHDADPNRLVCRTGTVHGRARFWPPSSPLKKEMLRQEAEHVCYGDAQTVFAPTLMPERG